MAARKPQRPELAEVHLNHPIHLPHSGLARSDCKLFKAVDLAARGNRVTMVDDMDAREVRFHIKADGRIHIISYEHIARRVYEGVRATSKSVEGPAAA